MAGGTTIVKPDSNLEVAQSAMNLLSSAEFQTSRSEVASGCGSDGQYNLSGLPEKSSMTMLELDYLTSNKKSINTR